MYFFTADQHLGHSNIIRFCNRPFKNVYEMDKEIIKRHNEVVSNSDIVIHAGDFAYRNKLPAIKYIEQLNGNNIFIKGSHDKWNKTNNYLWMMNIDGHYVVVCHYPFKTWPRSHYGSINLYGHCHGSLGYMKNQIDIGVDTNDFYPYSFTQIIERIKKYGLVKWREENED